jgi:hypothetical protein
MVAVVVEMEKGELILATMAALVVEQDLKEDVVLVRVRLGREE